MQMDGALFRMCPSILQFQFYREIIYPLRYGRTIKGPVPGMGNTARSENLLAPPVEHPEHKGSNARALYDEQVVDPIAVGRKCGRHKKAVFLSDLDRLPGSVRAAQSVRGPQLNDVGARTAVGVLGLTDRRTISIPQIPKELYTIPAVIADLNAQCRSRVFQGSEGGKDRIRNVDDRCIACELAACIHELKCGPKT